MTDARSIHLRYFALLREQRGHEAESLSSVAATPGDLYRDLAAQYGFTLPPESVRAAVNDAFADMDAPLHDGDRVVFIPPVAGG